MPHPLPDEVPKLSSRTFYAVSNARAALAALDSTARQLPNPTLFRRPSIRREAQSTSALEGTFAPLSDVLLADDEAPKTPELTEILNFVRMANHGFDWVLSGRPMTTGFLCELQSILMKGTPVEPVSGRLRDVQVVIGKRTGAVAQLPPVQAARFVTVPPGDQLESGLTQLINWVGARHQYLDPVVAAAMCHYQFETLHPFQDGNGRIGRFLIVLHLIASGVLTEPTLTVSPWFEHRRGDYYDALLAVSIQADWDGFVSFFTRGLQESADDTRRRMLDLVAVQTELKNTVLNSKLRSKKAASLVDIAVSSPQFDVGMVREELAISHQRATDLIKQLIDLGILEAVASDVYKRRYYSPQVMEVLLRP